VAGGVALAAGHGSSTMGAPATIATTLPPMVTLANLSAKVTSPQEGMLVKCSQSAFFTVSLTNTAPALVFVNGVRLHTTSVGGDCTAAPDFTYSITNSQVGQGTADVLNNQEMFSGGVGCCEHSGCGGDTCSFQFSFTVLTNVGEVPAGAVDYAILFNGCATCSSSVRSTALRCTRP
jgi:hypothetical protein